MPEPDFADDRFLFENKGQSMILSGYGSGLHKNPIQVVQDTPNPTISPIPTPLNYPFLKGSNKMLFPKDWAFEIIFNIASMRSEDEGFTLAKPSNSRTSTSI